MSVSRIAGVVVVALGVVLLVLGIRALDSFGSQFKEFFTGSPTDKAVWLTIGGVVLIVAGGAGAVVPWRRSAQ